MENKTVCTLVFLVDNSANKILLAMKKRGFGAGKWNGYGGKVKPGESLEAAAVRELYEEAEVTVKSEDLQKVAVNTFYGEADLPVEMHTYFVYSWDGEPVETEEMRPKWYAQDRLPFEAMWADDPLWLPRALAGETFVANYWFKDGDQVEKYELVPVEVSQLNAVEPSER